MITILLPLNAGDVHMANNKLFYNNGCFNMTVNEIVNDAVFFNDTNPVP